MIRLIPTAGLATLGLAASLLVPSTAYAADDYSMQVLSQKGSGCPSGTVEPPTYDDDNKVFNIVYNAFKVTGGQMKNCQLTVKVHVPVGISFAIYQMTNRGMGYLPDKTAARLTSGAYFAGLAGGAYEAEDFTAPLGDDGFAEPWEATTEWTGGAVWSKCGESRKMFIKNNLQVKGNKSAFMELQDTDVNVSTYFYLATKPCK